MAGRTRILRPASALWRAPTCGLLLMVMCLLPGGPARAGCAVVNPAAGEPYVALFVASQYCPFFSKKMDGAQLYTMLRLFKAFADVPGDDLSACRDYMKVTRDKFLRMMKEMSQKQMCADVEQFLAKNQPLSDLLKKIGLLP